MGLQAKHLGCKLYLGKYPRRSLMVGLLGIDEKCLYVPALRLIGRLQFEGVKWHFAHFQPPFTPVGMPIAPADELVDAIANERQFAEQMLNDAANSAAVYRIEPQTHLSEGSAGRGMISLADSIKSGLVAIGSRQSGPFASAMLGSVGRALAIGANQSVLIGRGPVAAAGDVAAVFATDYSAYCQRALEKLISMKPKGLKSLVLVTAYEVGELADTAHYVELYKEAAGHGVTLFERLKLQCESAVSNLRAAGFQASYELKPGKVNSVITRALEEHPSDLVIMGAQGHGFMERLVVGSTALHQAVSETHSLLILRA